MRGFFASDKRRRTAFVAKKGVAYAFYDRDTTAVYLRLYEPRFYETWLQGKNAAHLLKQVLRDFGIDDFRSFPAANGHLYHNGVLVATRASSLFGYKIQHIVESDPTSRHRFIMRSENKTISASYEPIIADKAHLFLDGHLPTKIEFVEIRNIADHIFQYMKG